MGEPKLSEGGTIEESAKRFKVSPEFLRKHIKLGVIPVVKFNGRPMKPYRILYKDLEQLFTVAALGSLKIKELEKALGRKPSKKEELWQ